MSLVRLIAVAALIALLAFTFGMIKGASDQRAAYALAQARADQDATQANGDISNASGAAASNQAFAQARSQTEAADARREIENFSGQAPDGVVGSGAMVDPALGRLVLCRVERLRGLAASPACDAADRVAREPGGALPARPAA